MIISASLLQNENFDNVPWHQFNKNSNKHFSCMLWELLFFAKESERTTFLTRLYVQFVGRHFLSVHNPFSFPLPIIQIRYS